MSTVLDITNKPVDSETHEDDEIEPIDGACIAFFSNPHQNASSWPYYWDQGGTSGLNLDHVAANEERDMTEQVWTTSRQHLTHCASTLKRTIWSYEKGHGHYDAVSQLSHAHHCINTLLKGAILAE
ncbi:hypothetical protein ARSEF1564_005077 [Beauveria bassiana]